MDQFIRVRLIQCNSLDLNLFQFDYDLTFAAFFLNADRTIYGRFGTRSSQKDASRDITITGFRKAMEGALELHRDYPANRASLVGKTGPQAKFRIPQAYPSLEGRYSPFLDYQGQVARGCIHCHQLGEAVRKEARSRNTPMPDSIVYPWPMPNVVGLVFDPEERATLKSVMPDSAAEKAGFRAGDRLISLAGQPLLSTADVQWVLHQAKSPTVLKAVIERQDRQFERQLTLAADWRRHSDLSWRTTSWDLRRIATGGLLLESVEASSRAQLPIRSGQMALRVKHVGQYGDHAVAKRAGFKTEDIIVSFDGLDNLLRETDVFTHILREHQPGDLVPVEVIRGTAKQTFQLKIQ